MFSFFLSKTRLLYILFGLQLPFPKCVFTHVSQCHYPILFFSLRDPFLLEMCQKLASQKLRSYPVLVKNPTMGDERMNNIRWLFSVNYRYIRYIEKSILEQKKPKKNIYLSDIWFLFFW